MAKAKTAKPTGLAVTRSGLSFVLTWKCGDKNYNNGQQIQWRTNLYKRGQWSTSSVAVASRKATVALNVNGFYPVTKSKLTYIQFRVRGKQKKSGSKIKDKDWSPWSAVKQYDMKSPSAVASVSNSVSGTNVTFSWTGATESNNPTCYYKDCVYQYAFVTNYTEYKNIKNWGTATIASKSGSVTARTEGTGAACLRVKERSLRGDSGWKFTYHPFSTPYKPVINSCSFSKKASEVVWHASAKWTQNANSLHPVDSMEVLYLVGVPTGQNCSPPDGSFESAGTLNWKDKSGVFDWYSDDVISNDETIWIKVISKHDEKTMPSEPYRIKYGTLSSPSFGSDVETKATAKRLTVCAVNNSAVSDSKILVSINIGDSEEWYNVGVLGINGVWTNTFDCPDTTDKSYRVRLKAFYGSYSYTTSEDGYRIYTISPYMTSANVESTSGSMPKAPTTIEAKMKTSSSVRLNWDWAWDDANTCSVAWSTDEDAWESTNEPETYNIDSKVTSWIIADLEPETKYYFRVRLKNSTGDNEVLSPWSNVASFTLSSDLLKPSIGASNATVDINSDVILTCSYSSSSDVTVDVREVINGTVQDVNLSSAKSSVHTLSISDINALYDQNDIAKWTTGSQHQLVCRLRSETTYTDWSDPVTINIIPTLSITGFTNSLTDYNIYADDGETIVKTMKSLTSLPLTATVTGAGDSGTTTLSIIRESDYTQERPDEMNQERFAGEIAASEIVNGETAFSIDTADLVNQLDDGAYYYLVAKVVDQYGQEASQKVEFIVKWSHQPEVPVATVVTDNDNLLTKITVTEPTTKQDGDTFDIYRLSIDKPELIIRDGTYGTTYVDPYPAFGADGGHRIVNKTKYGDYITSDNALAWIDTAEEDGDNISSKYTIIDFDNDRISLLFNIDLSNTWSKDFTRTTYLGGSVVGDWNPAVTRDLKMSVVHIIGYDEDTINKMRRLAVYPGICHIRTKDGSSFACDIQVKESRSHSNKSEVDFELSISKVNPEGFDGMTLSEWNENNTEA